MNLTTKLLQISEKIYKQLEIIPTGDERTSLIESVNELLDERGLIIEELKNEKFNYNPANETHSILYELDRGISDRLDILQQEIKQDIKILNHSKKHELQYINPYASVQVMDGRYYDKRK